MTNERKIRRARNLDGKRKELMKKKGVTYDPYAPILDDMLFYELWGSRIFRSSPERIKMVGDLLYNVLFNRYEGKQE